MQTENQATNPTDLETVAQQAAETQKRVREYLQQLAKSMRGKKVRRNAPCPCGSGAKFKRCCLKQYHEESRELTRQHREKLRELHNAENDNSFSADIERSENSNPTNC